MTQANNSQWPAPLASHALRATVRLPGSKSLTNRELVLAAIANEPTEFVGALVSRDSSLMIEALRALGAIVENANSETPSVTPATLNSTAAIDCGLAGTV